MLKQRRLRKGLAGILAATMVFGILPPKQYKSVEVKAETFEDVFVTPDKLQTRYDLLSSTSDKSSQKVYFGQDANGKPYEWWIAGDENKNQSDVVLFAVDPLSKTKNFASETQEKEYPENTSCIYPGSFKPSKIYPNHYGVSDLRRALNSEILNLFSSAEQGLMKATTIETEDRKNDPENNRKYSVEDKLYAVAGELGNSYVTVGKNIKVEKDFWADGFWLRTPGKVTIPEVEPENPDDSDEQPETPEPQGINDVNYITSGAITTKNSTENGGVNPAFNLDLTNLLFASTAPVSKSTGVTAFTNSIMTFRWKTDNDHKIYSTVEYIPFALRIKNDTQDSGKDLFIYVQGHDGKQNWVYSEKITEDKIIPAELIHKGADLSACKIWIETVDSDSHLIYAKEAEKSNDQLTLKSITKDTSLKDIKYKTTMEDMKKLFPEKVEIKTQWGDDETVIPIQANVNWNVGLPQTENILYQYNSDSYRYGNKEGSKFSIIGKVNCPNGVDASAFKADEETKKEDAEYWWNVLRGELKTGLTVQVNGANTVGKLVANMSALPEGDNYIGSQKVNFKIEPTGANPVPSNALILYNMTENGDNPKDPYINDPSVSKCEPGTDIYLPGKPGMVVTYRIKAIAVAGGMDESDVVSAVYRIERPGEHTHDWDSKWISDTDFHWHKCLVEGCDEVKDKAKHTESNWIVDKEATENEAGSRHTECTVCGAKMQEEEIRKLFSYALVVQNGSGSGSYVEGSTVTIQADAPPAKKRFSEWKSRDLMEFKGGTDETDVIAKFVMPGKAITVAATYEDIPDDHEHKWDTNWTSDASSHWHKCTVDGCKEINDKALHTETDWIVDKEATATEVGKRHTECTICKAVVREQNIPTKSEPDNSGNNNGNNGNNNNGNNNNGGTDNGNNSGTNNGNGSGTNGLPNGGNNSGNNGTPNGGNNSGTSGGTNNGGSNGSSGIVKTGDTAPILLLSGLVVLSGGTLIGLGAAHRRRGKRKRR